MPLIVRCILFLCWPLLVSSSLLWHLAVAVSALPPADDIPEEVLRSEIIVDARSPIDGQPMTAQDYAELQVQLEHAEHATPPVSRRLKQTVQLLQLRKFLYTIFPFLPGR
jgi:hypothetical protein